MSKLKKIFVSLGAVVVILAAAVLGYFADDIFSLFHKCEYESSYTYNETYHWYKCKEGACDKVKDKEEHIDEDNDGICDKCYYGATAIVNGVNYTSLQEAVNSADDVTITLHDDLCDNGIITQAGKTVTIDLNGHTFNPAPSVGSAGTETNGLQLLKDSTVILKNGTLKATAANKILIQNYSNLTLENMVLDGSLLNGAGRYVLSNNYGTVTIKGNTQIIAKDGDYAFDLYYGMASVYNNGISVTFDDTFTGKVVGMVEYGPANRVKDTDWLSRTSLVIKGGDFSKALFKLNSCDSVTANITLPEGKTFVVENSFYKISEQA